MSGHRDEIGYGKVAFPRTDTPSRFVAIHYGHLAIDQNDVAPYPILSGGSLLGNQPMDRIRPQMVMIIEIAVAQDLKKDAALLALCEFSG